MRFRALDGWRGICALLVAAHHLEVRGVLYWQPLVRNAWLFVDFFFVLSGFVVTHAYSEKLACADDVKSFVVRRLGRLWPLHVAILAALVVIEASRSIFDGAAFAPDRSVFAIFTNLLLVHSLGMHDFETWNGPSWSISTEFFTYLVFAALCLVAPRRPVRLGMSALLALAGAFVLARFSRYGMRETFHFGIARCIFGFFLGSLTYEAWRRGVASIFAGTLTEGIVLLLVTAFMIFVPGNSTGEYFAPLLFCSAVLVFSGEAGFFSRVLLTRPCTALGRWSYSLYMVHTLVLVMLFSGIRLFEIATGNHWLAPSPNGQSTLDLGVGNDLVLLAYLAASVALAACTWRVIEQPGQRLFAALVPVGRRDIATQMP